jgi:hypothetical protein
MAVAKGERKDPPRDPRVLAKPGIDRFDGVSFISTLVGWVALLLGQRVFDAEDAAAGLLSYLGVGLIGLSFVQRLMAAMQAKADRKSIAVAFGALSAIGMAALAAYYATSDAGREMFGVALAKPTEPDLYGDALTVAWASLVVISLLPTILGEVARRSMRHAERIESRRVVAAVVAGLALSFAAVYGGLFTFGGGKLAIDADFSYFRVAKPGASTLRMVDSLEQPLKVLVFFPQHNEVREKVVGYLESLRKRTDKLELAVHDRLLVPDLAKEHKVNRDGVVVLVRDKMSQTLDIGVDAGRAASKLKKLDGEFQKALLKAMRDKRTAYLTVGHNEINQDNDRKAGRTVRLVRALLESQHYGIKDLGPAQGLGNEVPDDASLVMVLGPSEPFSEPEVEALRAYAERGGKLFLALDGDSKVDLAPLAAIAGVKWQPGIVLNDKVMYRVKRNESDRKILVAKRFSSHASVSTLSKYAARGAAVLVAGAAPLDKLEDIPEGLKVDFAVKSVPGSYADLDGNWTFDKDSEKKATYNLAAASSRTIEGGEEMRAFVLGDAEMFSDPFMDFAKTNRLLLVEAVRWLGGEESFTGEIEETEDVRIVHTKQEDQLWFYTTILGVPLGVLAVGLVISRRRRTPKRPAAPAKPAAKPAAREESEPEDAEEDDEDYADADADAESESHADAEEDDEDEEQADDADEEEAEGADDEEADDADADDEEADDADDEEDDR